MTLEKRDKPVAVAILVRVSTTRQETDRQVAELMEYAEGQGYHVVHVARECISLMIQGDSLRFDE